MPIFEQVRDRLPTLYRPSDDDAQGDLIPLRAADILRLNGSPPPGGSLTELSGTIFAELPLPLQIREIRLRPGVARGSLLNLELYRMNGSVPLPLPGLVARVQRDVARFDLSFAEGRFAIRLRRPELLTRLLFATSRVLERTQSEANEVMQSHWFAYADYARFNPYFARVRELEELGTAAPEDPTVVQFPYIYDLARIGALLATLPWREPAAHREKVEGYRQRIRRIVELYRNGLGTLDALRRMTEVQLPVDLTAPDGLRDRPFTIEEYARVLVSTAAAQARGAPIDLVGPLMRWSLASDGHFPSTPTIYIDGQAPIANSIDATTGPLLELFSAGGARKRVGIAYAGTVPAGQTLRLRASHSSWIATSAGVRTASALPTPTLPADPTAPGPWADVAAGPTAPVTALVQATDAVLWAVTSGVDPSTALSRFDGTSWSEALAGLPAVRSALTTGDDLLLGTEAGLLRVSQHPAGGDPFTAVPDPATLGGAGVNALLEAPDGTLYVGSDDGLFTLAAADALVPFVLGADPATATAVNALHLDATGTLHVGTDLGLFRHQTALDHWYWYRGEERSDQHPDWVRFDPAAPDLAEEFPTSEQVFLPPVRSILRGPDASLWIGTDRGIARYIAFAVRGLAYTTMLQAHPDLATGRVHAIREDERGLIWFATEQGLFRFDGRDWWQVQAGNLVRLPTFPDDPRQWRFNRALDRWEFFDFRNGIWMAFAGEPRGIAEDPVFAVTWTDGAVADLGSWDGSTFTPDDGAVPAALRMRYKPVETRIVDGGIPAIPRIPPGPSVWRYLALETEPVPEPSNTPAWTIEGRLLPPPPDREPVLEGRFGAAAPLNLSNFDDSAFAFNPAAKVWISWGARHPLAVLVRLRTLTAGERIDPAILDRVWQGIQQVRPAGVRTLLAVDEEIVRGDV